MSAVKAAQALQTTNAAGARLKVGVIGAGRGEVLLAHVQRHHGARVVAVADEDPDRARAVADRHDVPAACANLNELLAHAPDAVIIASPPARHAEQAVTALAAGCHVLSEVPAVVSLAEARALVQAVRTAGKVYMLAENACFQPLIRDWQKRAERGELGRLVYAEAEYIHDIAGHTRDRAGRPTWRHDFPPIQYCTHSLGPLLLLSGERCASAAGFGTGTVVRPDYGADDLELGVFKTERGAVIKVLCGFSVRRSTPRSLHYFSLYGTEGVFESSRAPGDLEAMAESRALAEPPMIDAFIGCATGRRANPIDVYTALDYTLPGIIAHQSAQSGGAPLPIPDPRTWSEAHG